MAPFYTSHCYFYIITTLQNPQLPDRFTNRWFTNNISAVACLDQVSNKPSLHLKQIVFRFEQEDLGDKAASNARFERNLVKNLVVSYFQVSLSRPRLIDQPDEACATVAYIVSSQYTIEAYQRQKIRAKNDKSRLQTTNISSIEHILLAIKLSVTEVEGSV